VNRVQFLCRTPERVKLLWDKDLCAFGEFPAEACPYPLLRRERSLAKMSKSSLERGWERQNTESPLRSR
jgi:hypothetical protein